MAPASTEVPPPLPAPPRRRRFGCFLYGCTGSLALTALALVLFSRWALRVGVQVPTHHIVGQDTVAVLHVDDPRESAGAENLCRELLERMREEVESEDDGGGPWDFGWGEDGRIDTRLLPTGATLALDTVPGALGGQRLERGLALNLSAFIGPLRSLLATDPEVLGWSAEERDDGTLELRLEDDATEPASYVGWQHDTLLVTDAGAQLTRLLARTVVGDEPGPAPDGALRGPLEDLRRDAWISLAMAPGPTAGDGDRVLATLLGLEEHADALAFAAVPHQLLTLAANGEDGGLRLRLELTGMGLDHGGAADDVDEAADALEALLDELARTVAERGGRLTHGLQRGRTSLAADALLEDLVEVLLHAAEADAGAPVDPLPGG